MGYIHTIATSDGTYLIEPLNFITTNTSNSTTALTATLENFSLVEGISINLKIANIASGSNVGSGATLSIYYTTDVSPLYTEPINIFYNGTEIANNILKNAHIYTLVYDGINWNVVGELDGDSYAPINHSHTPTITTSNGTNDITLAHGEKYQLAVGGSPVIFTMPDAQIVDKVKQTEINNSSTYYILTSKEPSTSIQDATAYEAAYNTNIYITPSTGMITATTFTGALNGNATSATSAGTASILETAREMHVSLTTIYNSNDPVTFDGSAATTLPITGILPVSHGGTGNNTITQYGVVYGAIDNNINYLEFTTAGGSGYPLIGQGNANPPIWYSGLTLGGTAGNWTASLNGSFTTNILAVTLVNSDLIPKISSNDNTTISNKDLGSDSAFWNNLYISNIYVGSNLANNVTYKLYVNGASLFNGVTSFTGNLVPTANTYTLGTSENKWGNIYVIEANINGVTNANHSLYVNGESIFNGNASFNGDLIPSSASNNIGIENTSTNPITYSRWNNLYITNINANGTSKLLGNVGIGINPDVNIALTVNGTTKLMNNVGIGIDPNQNYLLTIHNGSIQFTKNIINSIDNTVTIQSAAYIDINSDEGNPLINFYPATNEKGTLGLSSTHEENNISAPKRWGAVYIGHADTYGDIYTPIYWNNGVPAEIDVVKKYTFTITNGTTVAVVAPTNTNKVKSIVTEIVIDTGISNLRGPITWDIPSSGDNANKIVLTTSIATSGDVSGYILVSIGS